VRSRRRQGQQAPCRPWLRLGSGGAAYKPANLKRLPPLWGCGRHPGVEGLIYKPKSADIELSVVDAEEVLVLYLSSFMIKEPPSFITVLMPRRILLNSQVGM